MKSADKPAFAKLMAGLGVLYGKSITQELVEIYWRALKHLDIQEVEKVITLHIDDADEGKWWPQPGHLKRYLTGGGASQALQAWSKAVRAINRPGPYATVVFDDPIIHAVIYDMGGWIKYCQLVDKDHPFKSLEFEKRYRGYLVQSAFLHYPKQLPGIEAKANQTYDKPIVPTLIGDPIKAKQVFDGGNDPKAIHHTETLVLEISDDTSSL